MELLLDTETERELAAGLASVNLEGLTDNDLEEVGAWMTGQAVFALDQAGISFQHAYSQRVGVGEIIQEASPAERLIWESAIAACWQEADAMLQALAKAAMEAREEMNR